MKAAEVKRLVAQFYCVSRAMMEDQCRQRAHAWPRQVAMALARRYSRASMPQIGRLFGDRDHTTVIHAIRRVEVMARDPLHSADLALLCGQLEAGAISQTSAWAELTAKRRQNVAQAQIRAEQVPDLAAEREFRRRILSVRIADNARRAFAEPIVIPPLAVLVREVAA